LDHETHEKTRKAFVTFATFRGLRGPKTHAATAAGDTARVREALFGEVEEIDEVIEAHGG